MTEKDFTNRIDGLINDYEGGESTSKELRDGILDTLIELVSKVSPFEARVKPKIAGTVEEYEKSIGMDILKEKHRAKTKYWMALSPHWADRQLSDKQKTEYRIVYWVNYGDDETYGWFTVEQIRQWLETPKLKLYKLGGTRERESNFSV